MDIKKNPEGESREIKVQQSSEEKTATVSTTSNQPKSADSSVSLPSFGLKRKSSSGISSSNGGSGNSGNNSDNSANSGMVSLGNNSFGFNFDCEEGFSNSSPTLNSDDGDGPKRAQQLKKPRRSEQETSQHSEAAENAVANLTSIANTYKNANQGEFVWDSTILLCYAKREKTLCSPQLSFFFFRSRVFQRGCSVCFIWNHGTRPSKTEQEGKENG